MWELGDISAGTGGYQCGNWGYQCGNWGILVWELGDISVGTGGYQCGNRRMGDMSVGTGDISMRNENMCVRRVVFAQDTSVWELGDGSVGRIVWEVGLVWEYVCVVKIVRIWGYLGDWGEGTARGRIIIRQGTGCSKGMGSIYHNLDIHFSCITVHSLGVSVV